MIYFYYYVHTLSFLSSIFQQVKYTIFPPSLFGNIIVLMHTSKRDSQKANTPGVLFIDDIIFTVSPSSIHCYSQLSKKYIHCSVMKVVCIVPSYTLLCSLHSAVGYLFLMFACNIYKVRQKQAFIVVFVWRSSLLFSVYT